MGTDDGTAPMTGAEEARPDAAPGGISVQIVHGHPLVDRAAQIYQEMLAAAGVTEAASLPPPQSRGPMRTTFHVAIDGAGTALGVVHVTLGSLEDVISAPLVDPEQRLATPICEASSISVLPEATGQGVTELLYRSVYCFARRQGAQSLVTVVDPLTLELFREDYGIMFRALGPVTNIIGMDLVAAGEEIHTLEQHLRRHRPEFLEFLADPLTPTERVRYGI